MKNQYTHKTKVLGLPVPGDEDSIWPEVEMKKWQFVENLLLAATRGLQNCVFTEGDFSVEGKPDGTVSVVLRALSGTAATGIAGGAYFNIPSQIRWDGLSKDRNHYLFLCPSNKTYSNPADIRAVSFPFDQKLKRQLLMAVVVQQDGNPVLDTHPDGKSYADSLSGPALMMSPSIQSFQTGGKNGVLLNAGGKVSFVQVCKIHSDTEQEMGEVSVGYFGEDDKVISRNQVVVYNSGNLGIPARAMIFCE